MSGLLMGHAFYEKLPALQKLLLLAIADHANDDGYGAYPSQKRLAEKVGCSTRHINTLTSALVSQGLLAITLRGDGRGNTTRYHLPWAESVHRNRKGEKVEVSVKKAEVQSSSEPSSLEPSEDSVSSDSSSKNLPSPPPAAFPDAVNAFLSAPQKERVAKLIELGYALGYERSGIAANIVATNGHGRKVVDAMVSALSATGDPWEYVKATLRNGRNQHETAEGYPINPVFSKYGTRRTDM